MPPHSHTGGERWATCRPGALDPGAVHMAQGTLEGKKSEHPNKVKITDAGPCKKKILIEIPSETVAGQLGTSLDTLQVEADIPGFRRGRAPRRLVERKFGTIVRKEAKQQLIASAYTEAIEEHKIRVIGDPVSEQLEKVELEDGKPLVFEVEIEVPPQFDLPTLDGIAVKKPMIQVTDEMVAEQVEKLKLQEGKLESQEAPEAGDYLTGHGKVIGTDGVTHVDIMDAVVQVPPKEKGGKGMILGIKVDDFGPQLGLPTVGKTATIKTTGPEQHEVEAIRGQPITIEFTVSRVDRIVPASDEEILARYGFTGMDQLQGTVRERIQERVNIDQAAAMREQIARHLAEAVSMELPERLTAGQTERTLARQRYELMHRGVAAADIEENLAELRAASGDAAARELKLFFILDKAAEQMGVRVSEAEINARISQMAMQGGERPEKLKAELAARGQIGGIFQQIREHKTLDALLEKATITEVDADEYNKEREADAKKRGDAKPKKAAAPKAKKDDDEGGEKKAAKKPAKK